MITIEKDVPMPANICRNKYYEIKEVMMSMEIGDSFIVPTNFNAKHVQSSLHTKIKSSGRKFSFRKYVGKVRCWRVK